MNPDIIGCVWTGEFDLNTLRVDGEILAGIRKEKVADTNVNYFKEIHKETKESYHIFIKIIIYTVKLLLSSYL